MSRLFFTADTHFGHDKVRRYSNRPFTTTREMDAVIIDNINSVARDRDRLYHLGDFAFVREPELFLGYRHRIRCRNFYLLPGNHDMPRLSGGRGAEIRDSIVILPPLVQIRYNNQKIILCHYPMMTWNCAHHGSWHLHGHCHGNLHDDGNALRMDVGVDPQKFMPVGFNDVAKFMEQRKFVPVDHRSPSIV